MTATLTEPIELTCQQISLCPACLMDMCYTCFAGTCLCACQDSPPPVIREPVRCRRCGYVKTMPGHLIACEPPEVKRARLEEATAECYGASR